MSTCIARLKNVTFAYPGQGVLLRSITCTLNQASRVAFLGANGARIFKSFLQTIKNSSNGAHTLKSIL
jgi:ABC-type Mn2+/Zn2+ transport system ATPase subunit